MLCGAYSLTGSYHETDTKKHNEDRYSIHSHQHKGLHLFGVYDGNGKEKELILDVLGIQPHQWHQMAPDYGIDYDIETQWDPQDVSSYLSKILPLCIEDIILTNQLSEGDEVIGAVKEVFCEAQKEVAPHCKIGNGSTAVILVFLPNSRYFVVANSGDSRAIHCVNNTALQLSVDHTPDTNFGSSDFSSKTVHIRLHKLREKDQFFLLLSDGVYNAWNNNQEVVDYVCYLFARYEKERINKFIMDGDEADTAMLNRIAKKLVIKSRKKEEENETHKIDDMTAVIVKVREEAVKDLKLQEESLSSHVRPSSWLSRFFPTTMCAMPLIMFCSWNFFKYRYTPIPTEL